MRQCGHRLPTLHSGDSWLISSTAPRATTPMFDGEFIETIRAFLCHQIKLDSEPVLDSVTAGVMHK
jgi:hypothetical protein